MKSSNGSHSDCCQSCTVDGLALELNYGSGRYTMRWVTFFYNPVGLLDLFLIVKGETKFYRVIHILHTRG